MTTYAFTGPARDLTPREVGLIRARIDLLRDVTGLRFGGARGVDSSCAYAGHDLWPQALRTIIAPRAPWSHTVPPGTALEYAPAGKNTSDTYMVRNTVLVGPPTDALIAFTETVREVGRSGSWATVRRARRRGLPVQIVPLSGEDPYWEKPELSGVLPEDIASAYWAPETGWQVTMKRDLDYIKGTGMVR